VSGNWGFFLQHEVPVEFIDRDFAISPGGARCCYFEDTDVDDSLSARRGKTQPGRGK
jgi:hypothetical protein